MRSEDKPSKFELFCLFVLTIIALLFKLWEYFAARRIGPITRTPVFVFPGHNFKVKESHEGVRFLCGYTMFNDKGKWNKRRLTEKLKSFLNTVGCSLIYRDARVIMIKMNGFVHGGNCHDFEPESGAAPGSYYTYQMYGNNRIQVTNYVKDGVSYLAGFCVYIQEYNSAPATYREDIVRRIMWAAKFENGARLQQEAQLESFENIPTVNREACSVQRTERVTPENSSTASSTGQRVQEILTEDFPTTNWNVKYCESLQREVMTTTSNGTVFHKEWNNMLDAMTIHKCAECVESDQPPAYTTLFME